MASACVNNISLSPENFSATYSSYGWLSPRLSFGRDKTEEDTGMKKLPSKVTNPESDPAEFVDFEFRLQDPVAMLPADELFSDGKLVPMQLPMLKPRGSSSAPSGVSSPDTPPSRRENEVSGVDPYLFSPRAPRCSSRWKELLGLRKLYQSSNNGNAKQENHKTASVATSSHHGRSLKHFLHRNSKSSNDSSLNLPLLKETNGTDAESISVSSRLSLSSSSSSGNDHDEFPRLSLDSDKPVKPVLVNNSNLMNTSNPPRVRIAKVRSASAENAAAAGISRICRSPIRRPADSTTAAVRGVSVDSPRMNSSGKIVFHSLERSSSSPSTFNGGPRFKHRGMERSYSANVRVTPVLNVPVCSLRSSSKSGGVFGFPLFSSPQAKNQPYNGAKSSRTDRP